MKKLLLICTLLIAILSSCKKYEDGPCISFRSASERIGTKWIVELFKINDVDNTQLYKDSCNCNFVFADRHQHNPQEFYYENCKDSVWIFGRYLLESKKTEIYMEPSKNIIYFKSGVLHTSLGDSTVNYFGPISTIIKSNWTIKRLTKKELWIETTYQDSVYFIEFKNGYL